MGVGTEGYIPRVDVGTYYINTAKTSTVSNLQYSIMNPLLLQYFTVNFNREMVIDILVQRMKKSSMLTGKKELWMNSTTIQRNLQPLYSIR